MRFTAVLTVLAIMGLMACSSEEKSDDLDANPEAAPTVLNNKHCAVNQLSPRKLRLLTRTEYQNTIFDLFGYSQDVTATFPVEANIGGYFNNAESAVVTSRHVDEYMRAASIVTQEITRNGVRSLVSCDYQSDPLSCATRFVNDFGLKAYRRPLSEDEASGLLTLFGSPVLADGFENGVRAVIESLLLSPNFLYRQEMGVVEGDYYRLQDYEVASALSYLLWQSMPDDRLLAAASKGELSTPEEIRQMASLMLDDPRARDAFVSFSHQWLGTHQLQQVAKSPEIFPSFNEQIRTDLQAELEQFISHVVFDKSGLLKELMTAEFSVLNARLDEFYGLGLGATERFSATPVPEQRYGLLTKGALLASLAHPSETSPVARGIFVRERLLCHTLPVPGPDIDTTPPGLDPDLTTRDRFRRHSEDPACASCHDAIDAIGFGFEGYDAVGLYRQIENGLGIDQSGEVLGIRSLSDESTLVFDGVVDLAQALSNTDQLAQCFAQQFITHAAGKLSIDVNSCVVNEEQKAIDSNLNIREFILDYVGSDFFTARR